MPTLNRAQLAKMPKHVRDAVEADAAARAWAKAAYGAKQTPQTEQNYALRLQDLNAIGEIHSFEHQPKRLVLARGCTYTPDFRVITHDGSIQYHEVKGSYVWDDAIVKWKCAGERYRQYRFIWAQWKSGQWSIKTYKPLKDK